jgi:hypothetical protein
MQKIKTLYFAVSGKVNIEEFAYAVVTPRDDLMTEEEKNLVEREKLIPTKCVEELEISLIQPGCKILGPSWRGIFAMPTGIFIKFNNIGEVDKGILITGGGYDILKDPDRAEYSVYWVFPDGNFLWISRSGNSFLQFAREVYGVLISSLKEREFAFSGEVTSEGLRMLLCLKSAKITELSLIKETITYQEVAISEDLINQAREIAKTNKPLNEFEKILYDFKREEK